MSNETKIAAAVAATLALATAASSAQAQEKFWEFNVAPYLWGAGIDTDVTVGNRSATVERDFGDVVDALDIGGGLMGGARFGRFVMVSQLDFLGLDSDNLDDAPARGRLESDIFMAMFAAGVRLGDLNGRSHVDVLLGGRNLSMDNTLSLDGFGTTEHDKDFVDPIIMVRPSFRLSDRWRFNATLSYGEGGDSEKTYELQPHIEYRINDWIAARFGYRKLHYEIDSDNQLNRFDGSFQGLILGVGGTFGRAPIRSAQPMPAPTPAPVAAAAPAPQPVAPPPPPSDTDADGIADHIDKCPSTARGEKVDPVGCAYDVQLSVLFENNSDQITESSFPELKRIVEALNSTPTLSAIIEGHTDAAGSAAFNQSLSERRARSVADYLTANGVNGNRLQARGYGESRPVADNTTPEGRAQNRRVVLRRPDAG